MIREYKITFDDIFSTLDYSWCFTRVKKMHFVLLQTGTTIIIRGKGSVKEGKVGYKDGRPLPAQDEPLHAYITAASPENVKKAVDKV